MPGPTYLAYYDQINDSKARSLMAACAEVLASTQPDRLYFLFSSLGGSVDAGVALFNFLRALPVPVTMHNTGSVDSIANVVFLAADERFANSHSTFLLHGVQWGFGQGAQLSRAQLQETMSRFSADEARMAGIITDRTSITSQELESLLLQGESKDLAFALSKGLIHGVKEAKIPVGAPFFALNFA